MNASMQNTGTFMLSKEIELLMAERARLLRVAGAAAQFVAVMEGRALPEHVATEAEILAFARLYGSTKRAFLRLGYGFTRSRNGAASMHAASCLPVVSGAWQHQGGGALYNFGELYHWDKTMIEGTDARDPSVRQLDQSRIGPILVGDPGALLGGGPVHGLLVQNTNPMAIAPDLGRLGFLLLGRIGARNTISSSPRFSTRGA